MFFSILLKRHNSQFWTSSTESEVTSRWSVFCRPTQHGQVSSGQEVVPSGWKVWILRPHAQQVFLANACCECSAWIAEKASIRSQCRLILAFPEDPGGDAVDGPASIWSCHEYEMLERLHEAERGAACLCRLSSADHRGPCGVVSDIPNLLARLSPGWPSLQFTDSKLVCQGPLPKSCRCALPHRRRKKQRQPQFRTPQQQFLWAVNVGSVVSSTWFPTFFLLPLGMGIAPQSAARPRSSHLVSFPSSPCFSSRPGFYVAWLSGGLTRHALRDVVDSAQVSKYLDTPVPVSFPGSSRTSLMTSCEASSWFGYTEKCSPSCCFSCSYSSWCCRVGGPVVAVFFPSSVCPFWRSGETRCPSWCWSRVAFAKWRSRSFSSCLPRVVRVWQISVRVRVRFWMVLVMELHTLRQCGVRASLVRVSGGELQVHFSRGGSLHCWADRGHCGGTERPWPLSLGRIAMEACARCFLSLWRVARRTLQASGLCVEFPCLVCFSRSVLRSVCPGLVTLRDTTCRPSARIPGGYTAPSSGIRTRCRSSGGLRRYADTRLRWRGTRNYAGRCGHSRVAGWSVTALRSKSAMPTSSSKSTGVSSWTLATSTVSTQTFLLRQFSTSSHVSVRSQTRRTDLLLTPKTAGWRGSGKPVEVGLGYTSRQICDGQLLASPGRWSPEERRYPEESLWKAASEPIMDFTRRHGATALLTRLATGQVTESPFEEEAVARLEEQVVRALAEQGLRLNRQPEDREGLPWTTGFSSPCSARRRIWRSASVTSLEESVSDGGSGFRDSQLFTQRRRSGV